MGPKKKRVQLAGRVARARRRKLFGYVLKQGTLRLLRSREVVGSIPRVSSSIPSHKTKLLAAIPPLCRRCSCRGAKFSAERPPMDSARHVAPVGACPSCCERQHSTNGEAQSVGSPPLIGSYGQRPTAVAIRRCGQVVEWLNGICCPAGTPCTPCL